MIDSSVLLQLLGWLIVIGIGVPFSIGLHEIGHLVPAKKFGIKCPQYMIGFGPTIWSRQVGETEYGVKAIPLGGYVRMLGMFPPKPGKKARADTTGRLGLFIDSARQEAQREIGPEDGDRLFYQRSVPKRLIVMLGGPTMNLVIAIVAFTALLTLHGLPTLSTTIQTVSQCVVPVATDTAAKDRACTAEDPKAPAAAAGLLPGDQIVGFAGKPVTGWAEVRDQIRANTGTPVSLVVERGGAQVTTEVTPLVEQRYVLDSEGNPVKGADGKYETTAVGFLGVSPAYRQVPVAITEVPGHIGGMVGQVVSAVPEIPAKVYGIAKTVFAGAERDPEGPASIIGVGRLAGEVGAAEGTAASPVTFADRFWSWISLIGGLNLALFVFNLVPLLPLDGGHAAGALWEGARRQVNRLLKRPDPGPVDIARLLPMTYVVGSLLLLMSVLVMYADLVDPITFSG